MSSDTGRIADALYEARSTGRPIPPPSETFGLDDAEGAYAVQAANTARWLDEGRRLAGRKIGLTSEAVQRQLGVDEPDYGMLWADTAWQSGASIPLERFIQPKVEAEIAFVMAAGVDSAEATRADVEAAVGGCLTAIEIADSAVVDWRITLADTIADNASGGGFVLASERRPLGGVDLPGARMTLSRNGEVVSTGAGAACLGDPVNALLWVARKMAAVGRPLVEGDVVLSGALGPMVDPAAGDRFEVSIDGLATIELGFE